MKTTALLLALTVSAVGAATGAAGLAQPKPAAVAFAVLVSAGVAWAGSAFHRMQSVERWARRVTALVSFTIRAGSSL